MKVYLIRHTTPAIDKGICYGQSDIEVAESFQTEMEAIKRKLPASIARVYASPLKRCRALAEEIGAGTFETDERLRELNFGAWELQPWNDIDPRMLQAWMKDYVNVVCPGGESFFQLYVRAVSFWEELMSKPPQDTALVTHGGVIRCILAKILSIPLTRVFSVAVDFGKMTVVEAKDGLCYLKSVNA